LLDGKKKISVSLVQDVEYLVSDEFDETFGGTDVIIYRIVIITDEIRVERFTDDRIIALIAFERKVVVTHDVSLY
jgi:hypothetical protein